MGKPLVAIVMGSINDWEVMKQSAQQLKDFGVSYDARVISAHRAPDLLFDYIQEMAAQGVQCFIAGASKASSLMFIPHPLTKLLWPTPTMATSFFMHSSSFWFFSLFSSFWFYCKREMWWRTSSNSCRSRSLSNLSVGIPFSIKPLAPQYLFTSL